MKKLKIEPDYQRNEIYNLIPSQTQMVSLKSTSYLIKISTTPIVFQRIEKEVALSS